MRRCDSEKANALLDAIQRRWDLNIRSILVFQGFHGLGDFNNETSFSHNPGGHKSEIKVSPGQAPPKAPPKACRWSSAPCVLTVLPL